MTTGWLQYHVHMVAALGAPWRPHDVDVTPTPIQRQNTAIFGVVPQGVICGCILLLHSVEDIRKYSDPIQRLIHVWNRPDPKSQSGMGSLVSGSRTICPIN
jgi:hypothetical protein